MTHPHRIRDIAEQAGLSEATVDRVLNERPGVRPSTVAEVRRAIADLDRQHAQIRLNGRRFIVDLVMLAPQRFTSAVRSALEAELPNLHPAVFRSRFHLQEQGSAADVAQILAGIARRPSHGVLLKAPDDPMVTEAVGDLVDRGIPVITVATDLPMSRRAAYVGIDNRAAGATAAYLLTHVAGPGPGDTLVTLSSSMFRGEEEREMGFRVAMRTLAPNRVVHEVTETAGLDESMLTALSGVLQDHPGIDTVYSVGGGNRAILEAFGRAGRPIRAFIAHDLDADNVTLLRQHHLTAVLHHDLRADMRDACRILLRAHGALPGPSFTRPSQIQIVTPYNEPATV